MAKFLIVLAAALLQANAGPLELNPISWAFKLPKTGMAIASNVVGGVRDGLVDNGMGFVAGPLGMVQSGLQTPVGILGNLESSMPSFQLPSFSGMTGAGQDNQGLGGMMSNIFAMPQKFIGQATDMFGQGQGLLGGFAGQGQEMLSGLAGQGQGMFGGIQSQVQNSVAKLQDSLAELQGQIDTEQLIQMIKDNAAMVQEKTQGALGQAQEKTQEALAKAQEKAQGAIEGAKEQVEAAQKKIQEMQAQFAPQAQEMVQTIMQDLQKQAQEASAAGDNETVTKVQAQMKQVVEHANGLMGQLQAVRKPEEAQKIAEKFAADFTALYEKAKQQ